MLQESTLNFLEGLKTNNNKDWVSKNKEAYQQSKSDMLGLVDVLVKEIAVFDDAISDISEGKPYLMRLNRDTRFSANKDPYKTNFGIWITPLENDGNEPAYYIQVEPGNSHVGLAYWSPSTLELGKIRKEISVKQKQFLSIVKGDAFNENFTFDFSTALKNVPKDFEKDSASADFLRLKTYVAIKKIDDAALLDPSLATDLISLLKTVYPLILFFRAALQKEAL